MTIEISVKSSMDPTVIAGDFAQFINDLNIAAASGKQFVIAHEQRPDGTKTPVAFDTRNITRIRELETDDAFLRS
jgi:hypothetical protein